MRCGKRKKVTASVANVRNKGEDFGYPGGFLWCVFRIRSYYYTLHLSLSPFFLRCVFFCFFCVCVVPKVIVIMIAGPFGYLMSRLSPQ